MFMILKSKVHSLLHFLLTLVIVFTGVGVFGQISSGERLQQKDLFYYFGNEKVQLFSSKTHFYVEMSTRQDLQSLALNMQSVAPMAGAKIATIGSTTRSMVTLQNHEEADSILNWLRQQPGIIVARPAVFSSVKKDHFYEDAFYVKLKSGTTTAMLQNEAAKTGCTVVKPYDYDKRVYLLYAGAGAQFDGLQMANRFFETGLFEYAEPDFRPLEMRHNASNDPFYPLQWGLKNTGSSQQFNGIAGSDLGIEAAWAISRGSASIRIAVIDDGVDRTHPDLINNIAPLGFGLMPDNASTGSPLSPNNTHGTACAGIVAAESNNGIGIAGVAPLCKIIPVNLFITTTEGTAFGTFSQIASAIDWAWNQAAADVLTNSWGGGLASNLLHDAIKRAITQGRGGRGALVFFSTGNDDAGLAHPAIFPEVIAVGAMSMCNQRKSTSSCDGESGWGSNYGSGLDIAAPGVKIATTAIGGYATNFNGTSSACPFAAGVAALILSVNAQYSQAQVREILERSARKVGNYTYSRVPGQPNGSWTNELGYGMLSAERALLAAQNFDFACKVSISALGSTQFCQGGRVMLDVNDPAGAALYFWMRNGVQLQGGGNTLEATTTGRYQAIIVRPSGCRDTSNPIEVRVGPSTGTLTSIGGNDTAICPNTFFIMGGSPSATGGTPFHHPLRGLAHNLLSNELLRFDPEFPSHFFRTVKTNFNPNPSPFVGAANTPFGLFMLSSNNNFVKVDTATGQVFNIGVVNPQSGSWNGMTYNPVLQKVFALASSDGVNQLYEINPRTAGTTLLGTIQNLNNAFLPWLASNASGNMFTIDTTNAGSARIYRIGLNPPAATALPSGTGFQMFRQFQDGALDPITGKLLVFAITRPLGSTTNRANGSLWEANTNTGGASLIGAVERPLNVLDALAFAAPEYRYSWSPATYLSNPNDANPIFSGAPPGTYVYTLTVTDLCGQTAESRVIIRVKPVLVPNSNKVLFVNASATGNNTGNSWANAVRSLQVALEHDCNEVREIWVARGTYTPATSLMGGWTQAFVMRNNLAIYGGFAGNETQLSQRNWRLNPTRLSGNLGLLSRKSANIIRNDNNNLDQTAILDGFIISDGDANGQLYYQNRGAGMYNFNSSPLVRNCIFTNNSASVYGGAVFNQGATSTPTFINCVFSGNQAQFGGGIYNESAQTQVINCTFSSNQITGNGGGIYSYGTPKATVRNSIVWGNANNGIFTAAFDNSTPVEVSHSIVQGGYTGTNNRDQDPRFHIQAPVGLGQMGNLRLLLCSPALNRGNNAALPSDVNTDLAGLSRVSLGPVDCGAYEFQTEPESNDIYIDPTATNGTLEGSSWANAFTSLQAALNDMNLCSLGQSLTLHIATGTYQFPANIPAVVNNLNGRILGGYPPGGGTRNAAAHPVIIRGNVQVLKNVTIDGVRVQQ
jgi:subtilisin family serine protease